MGFFDLPERDPEDDELDVHEDDVFDDGPGAWVGGVVPVGLVVAQSEEAAVTVSRIVAYPDGFELTVNSYLRRSVGRARRRRQHHPIMWHDYGQPGEPIPDEFLRIGVAWPDGGQATNLERWGRVWPDATEPAHGLEEHGGGGSSEEYSQEFWAWPLPEGGPLRVVVEWPAFGISESGVALDGDLILQAAATAHSVWPEDADRRSHLSRSAMMRVAREHSTGRERRPDPSE